MDDSNKKDVPGPVFGKCQDDIPHYAMKKAEDELHETAEKCKISPAEIREIMKQNSKSDMGKKVDELFSKKDDDFLMRFVRARKFDLQQAYELMKGYVKFRQNYPELVKDLTKESVRHTLENGFPGICPVRDKQGRVVLLFGIGNWNAKEFPFNEVMRGYIYILEKLMESEETQINGLVLIENFKNYSMSQALSMTPSDLKKMVYILQGAFPARFKGIHFIYEPWYFSWTYSLVKPFLRAKFVERVHVHGCKLEKFHQDFDPAVIPEDFGGTGPKYNAKTMTKLILDSDENILDVQRVMYIGEDS